MAANDQLASCTIDPEEATQLAAGFGGRIFFAMYYSRPEHIRSFKEAADTWQKEVSVEHGIGPDDTVLLLPVLTGDDFLAAWTRIYDLATKSRSTVCDVALFTHASIKGRTSGLRYVVIDHEPKEEGIEFKGDLPHSSVTKEEIGKMEVLPWNTMYGRLTLHGCHTGNLHRTAKHCVAQDFRDRQGITVIGQSGYAYFSTTIMTLSEYNQGDSPAYLWAYHHRKNVELFSVDTGNRLPGNIYPART